MQKLPLVDENFYKQINTEMGFSVEEIAKKLQERQREAISYDDILDAISQINKKSTKGNGSAHPMGLQSYTGKQPTLSSNSTRMSAKLNDIGEPTSTRANRGENAHNNGMPSNGSMNAHLREQKSKHYFIGGKIQRNLNFTDSTSKATNNSKEQDLLDELYASSDRNSTLEMVSPNKGSDKANSDLNSFQHNSGDINKLSDCSVIEHTERSDVDSDWLASNDSNVDTKRSSQTATGFAGSAQPSHQTAVSKILSGQTVSSPTASGTYVYREKTRNEPRQQTKAHMIEINRGTKQQQLQLEGSDKKDSNSKNKSTQMLRQFLSTKAKTDTAARPTQNKSTQDNQLSFSTTSGVKHELSNNDAANNINRGKQRTPLSLAGNCHPATSNQSLITPRNAQKVPITKVSLGKNSENTLISPSKTNVSLRESADIAKSTSLSLNKSEISHKQPAPQALVEKNAKINPEFYAKFLDLLTSFNTFYNENSSLISSTDLSVINMINAYSIKHDFNNCPKVGICFNELASNEVKDMLIYPLLRTILGYVEVRSIHYVCFGLLIMFFFCFLRSLDSRMSYYLKTLSLN